MVKACKGKASLGKPSAARRRPAGGHAGHAPGSGTRRGAEREAPFRAVAGPTCHPPPTRRRQHERDVFLFLPVAVPILFRHPSRPLSGPKMSPPLPGSSGSFQAVWFELLNPPISATCPAPRSPPEGGGASHLGPAAGGGAAGAPRGSAPALPASAEYIGCGGLADGSLLPRIPW